MYLRIHSLVAPGAVHAADGVQDGNAVVGEQLVHLAEKLAVVLDPDMLEHADRDDPIEAAGQLAIVAQLKAHAIRHARALGPLRGWP